MYKAYVRPKAEHNTQVWSPYLKKDIKRIEQIQKRFTRTACMRCQIPFSSYEDRLFKLNLLSLEHRRIYHDLVYLFKIINHLTDIKFENYFRYELNDYNLRDSSLKLRPLSSSKNSSNKWLNTFFLRACDYWNKLPYNLKCIKCVNIFKMKVKKVDFDKLSLKLK